MTTMEMKALGSWDNFIGQWNITLWTQQAEEQLSLFRCCCPLGFEETQPQRQKKLSFWYF